MQTALEPETDKNLDAARAAAFGDAPITVVGTGA